MGMTIDNLCNSCTNIGCEFQSGIVRTKCAFYMPPHIESDNCGNYVVMQQTLEAIPKDQYEARLKADLVAMLTDIQLEIEELKNEPACCQHYKRGVDRSSNVIQQKINSLKENTDGTKRNRKI